MFSLNERKVLHCLYASTDGKQSISQLENALIDVLSENLLLILDKFVLLDLVENDKEGVVSITNRGRAIYLSLKGMGEIPDRLLNLGDPSSK